MAKVTQASPRYCCMNVALSYINQLAFYHACSTFYLVRAISAKLERHAGKMKFNQQVFK
jgi:hypothetical protein